MVFQTRKRKAKDGPKTGSEPKRIKQETRESKKSIFFYFSTMPVAAVLCVTIIVQRRWLAVRFYDLSRALHNAQHISRLLLIRR